MIPVPVSENAEARTMNDAILSRESVGEFSAYAYTHAHVPIGTLCDSHEALRSQVTDYREALAAVTFLAWACMPTDYEETLPVEAETIARARRLLEQENQ